MVARSIGSEHTSHMNQETLWPATLPRSCGIYPLHTLPPTVPQQQNISIWSEMYLKSAPILNSAPPNDTWLRTGGSLPHQMTTSPSSSWRSIDSRLRPPGLHSSNWRQYPTPYFRWDLSQLPRVHVPPLVQTPGGSGRCLTSVITTSPLITANQTAPPSILAVFTRPLVCLADQPEQQTPHRPWIGVDAAVIRQYTLASILEDKTYVSFILSLYFEKYDLTAKTHF